MALGLLPRQFVVDVDGAPRVGAKLYVYAPTTTDPITVYTTQAYDVEHDSPIESLASGFFPAFYIDPSVNTSYKVVITDADDVAVYNNDNIPVAASSAADVGALLYPQTLEEAGLTIVNGHKNYGNILRYGTNTTPGTTDMAAALQAAVDQMNEGGAQVFIPEGSYALSTTITGEVGTGFLIRGSGVGSTRLVKNGDTAMFTLTCSGAYNNQVQFEGMTLFPGTSVATANGIELTGAGAIPSLTMRDVVFLQNGTDEFLHPIHLVNCGETLFERVFLYGNSTAGTEAIYISTTGAPGSAATVHKFVACSIYNFENGVVFYNNTSPGIEGIQFFGCDIVGVERGVTYTNAYGAGYFPPQLAYIGGHINFSVHAFDVEILTQLIVQSVLMYGSGSDSFIKTRTVAEHLICNNFFQQVGGTTIDGIDIAAASGPLNGGLIANNVFRFDSTQAAVVFDADNYLNMTIQGNQRYGGSFTISLSGVLDNTCQFIDNTPDAGDIYEALTSAASIDLAGKRAAYFNLSTPGGATTITTISPRREGDEITLDSASTNNTLQHNASCVLAGGTNFNFPATGGRITLRYFNASWKEMGRSA
jgi:hypothetical protein